MSSMNRLRLVAPMLVLAVASSLVPGVASPAEAAPVQAEPPVDQIRLPVPANTADKIQPEVLHALAGSPAGRVPVIVHLAVQADTSSLAAELRARRRTEAEVSEEVVRSLQGVADENRNGIVWVLLSMLRDGWIRNLERYWIFNGFAAEVNALAVERLAAQPDVARIAIDRRVTLLTAPAMPPDPASWNLDAVRAPEAWLAGLDGSGVTIGVIDTGVDLRDGFLPGQDSPVANAWRGGTNSWLDTTLSPSATPVDSIGAHGTQVTSILVGGSSSGLTYGVAPGAEFIAARIFDNGGSSTESQVRAALQWMLDPDGNPATDDGADVVNNSWGWGSPSCDPTFDADLRVLRDAGVLPVFAAGNRGPTAGQNSSPANLPGAFAVGGVDNGQVIASISSRGPSMCDPGEPFPDLVAPGVNVAVTGAYATPTSATGTSVAAPHVTGAAALLLQHQPDLTPAELEAALLAGTSDLGDPGADSVYGSGHLDIVASLAALEAASVSGFVWTDTSDDGVIDPDEQPLAGVELSLVAAGADRTLGTADDAAPVIVGTEINGAYSFVGLAPGLYELSVGSGLLVDPFPLTLGVGEQESLLIPIPPPPGAVISGIVFDDANENGGQNGSELGLAGVGLFVRSAGLDDEFNSNDDTVTGPVLTQPDGRFLIGDLPDGIHRVWVDHSDLVEREVTTTPLPFDVSVSSGEVHDLVVGLHGTAPEEPILFFSAVTSFRFDGTRYRDEDIVAWDGEQVSVWFDGSDVGLARVDLDAFHVIDDQTIVFSVDRAIDLPGAGFVEDHDLVSFAATSLGDNTRGTFSLLFDGSDVGLAGNRADIDAIEVVSETELLLSMRGTIRLGPLVGRDEDVLRFVATSLGEATSGTWDLAIDGSAHGLTAASEDLDAMSMVDEVWYLSTIGTIDAGGVGGADHDVIGCDLSPSEACDFEIELPGADLGVSRSDIDGLHLDEKP